MRRAPFARMLYGQTPPSTRLVQLAFNRSESESHVLIAQSMVGREGLNLHESCRTVTLLHLEWYRVWPSSRSAASIARTASGRGACRMGLMPIARRCRLYFVVRYDEHHWSATRRWMNSGRSFTGSLPPVTIVRTLATRRVGFFSHSKQRARIFGQSPRQRVKATNALFICGLVPANLSAEY